MKCSNCKKKISDDSLFCPHCGAKIEKSVTCSSCGKENEIGSSFCKYCGSPIDKSDDALHYKKGTKITRELLTKIFDISAMSLVLLSVALVIGLSFTPFLYDDFFPTNDFTILCWLKTILSQASAYGVEGMYLTIANGAIMAVLFGLFILSSLSVFIVAIVKFIFALKKQEYIDMLKPLSIVYCCYLATYTYFYNFCLHSEKIYAQQIGCAQLFLLIFVPLVLAFLIFVKYYHQSNKNLIQLAIRLSIITISFIFIQIFMVNIFTATFELNGSYIKTANVRSGIYSKCTSFETVQHLMIVYRYVNIAGSPYISTGLIFAAVDLGIDLTMICLSVFIVYLLINHFSKPKSFYIKTIILMTILLILSVVKLFATSLCVEQIQYAKSLDAYRADYSRSVALLSETIIAIIMISIAVALQIGGFVTESILSNKGENKPCENI